MSWVLSESPRSLSKGNLEDRQGGRWPRRSRAVPSRAGWGAAGSGRWRAGPQSPRTGQGDQAAAVGQEGEGRVPSKTPEVQGTDASPPRCAHASGREPCGGRGSKATPAPELWPQTPGHALSPQPCDGGGCPRCAPRRASAPSSPPPPPGTRLDIFTDNASPPSYAPQLPHSQTPDRASPRPPSTSTPRVPVCEAPKAPGRASGCFTASRKRFPAGG